jgi:hypothetical protein
MPDTHTLPYSPAEVLAPYLDREDVAASISYGALLFKQGRRAVDLSFSDGVWRVVRLDGDDIGEALRVDTRADLDAHVAWCAALEADREGS